MNDDKQRKLEEKGFRVGSAAEFLKLTPEERSLLDDVEGVDLDLSLDELNEAVRESRERE